MTITEALKAGRQIVDCQGKPMKHIFTGKFPYPSLYTHIFIGKHGGTDNTNWHAFVDDNGTAFNIHTNELYDRDAWVSVKKEKKMVWVNMYQKSNKEIISGRETYHNEASALCYADESADGPVYLGAVAIDIEI